MMNLTDLALEIEKNQDAAKALIDLYRATDEEKNFLQSIKHLPPDFIPGIIRHFARIASDSLTVMGVIKNERVGVLFEVKETGLSYTWTGFNADNEPTFVELGKDTHVQLDPGLTAWRFLR